MTSIETSVFAKTIHKANEWLGDLRHALRTDSDEEAYRALRATLQVLRDTLTLREVADLSAQLPLVVRGVFLEGWSPGGTRPRLRHEQEFLAAVQQRYGPQPIDARQVVTAVFTVLEERISAGEIEDMKRVLPGAVRGLWPQRGAAVYLGDEQSHILTHAVGQFMSRDLICVSGSTPLQDALERMAEASVRHLIVLAPSQAAVRPIHIRSVIGMLSDRDALDVLRRHPDEDVRLEWHLVRDVMTHAPLVTVGPADSLGEAARRMHEEKIGALAVVERDELIGVITTDDLLYAGSLHLAGREEES